MKTKVLELRDRATFIPILAVDMNPSKGPPHLDERYLLRRAGYACDGHPIILLTRLDGKSRATYNPYDWGDRTFSVAHDYIVKNWHSLVDGSVVDVEFILGETKEPKLSECFEDL